MAVPIRIEKPRLVLTEGRDAKYFFIWACEAYRIIDIQVLDYGGVAELPAYMSNLPKLPGYEMVEKIVIVRDAETDSNAAVESINGALRNAGLPVPSRAFAFTDRSPHVAYMIFPGFSPDRRKTLSNGTLEDLCLAVVGDDAVLRCVNQYIQCLQSIGEMVKHPHKVRLHAYLAGKDDYAGLKIGEAAKAGAWNWDHEMMAPYKRIIAGM